MMIPAMDLRMLPALFPSFEMLSLLCVAATALLGPSTSGHHSITITHRQLEEDGGSQRSQAPLPGQSVQRKAFAKLESASQIHSEKTHKLQSFPSPGQGEPEKASGLSHLPLMMLRRNSPPPWETVRGECWALARLLLWGGCWLCLALLGWSGKGIPLEEHLWHGPMAPASATPSDHAQCCLGPSGARGPGSVLNNAEPPCS